MNELPDAEKVESSLTVATNTAKEVLDRADKVANILLTISNKDDARVTKSLSDALRDVFGEHESSGRFIDVARIPLICQSILTTDTRLRSIEDDLKWGVRIVLGAVILGVIALAFKI